MRGKDIGPHGQNSVHLLAKQSYHQAEYEAVPTTSEIRMQIGSGGQELRRKDMLECLKTGDLYFKVQDIFASIFHSWGPNVSLLAKLSLLSKGPCKQMFISELVDQRILMLHVTDMCLKS